MNYLTRRYSNTNNDLWGDFEHFFNASPFFTSTNPFFNWNNPSNQPAVDLYEDDSSYFVQAELPGFDRKEIQVELEKDRLILQGTRKEKNKDGKSVASFHRSVSLPDSVKTKAITAKYDNGLLTVTIPKAEAAKPLRIEIKN
jgi:HSP20 family protein